jgi:hypothetical protein
VHPGGYARHLGALHFHHVEPITKCVAINAKGVALALDALRAEAAKCVLLAPTARLRLRTASHAFPIQC